MTSIHACPNISLEALCSLLQQANQVPREVLIEVQEAGVGHPSEDVQTLGKTHLLRECPSELVSLKEEEVILLDGEGEGGVEGGGVEISHRMVKDLSCRGLVGMRNSRKGADGEGFHNSLILRSNNILRLHLRGLEGAGDYKSRDEERVMVQLPHKPFFLHSNTCLPKCPRNFFSLHPKLYPRNSSSLPPSILPTR